MLSRRAPWLVATLVLVLITGCVLVWRACVMKEPLVSPAAAITTPLGTASGGEAPGETEGQRPSNFSSLPEEVALIEVVREVAGGAVATDAITRLFVRLDQAPPEVRSRAILTFLESGADAPTNLPFSIGPGGGLRSWPTIRVAALDYVGRLEPATMRSTAELVLARRDSPDEWAIALRNLARAADRGVSPGPLDAKVLELLSHEAWVAAPSSGFLEAFDVVVHRSLLDSVGRLEELMAETNPPAVRFAAFLTADRFALLQPNLILPQLARTPQIFDSAPLVRAGLFARADVRDPVQRTAVESYLARHDLSTAEQEKFAALFPNEHRTFAHNLLTPNSTRSMIDMIARDRASLTTITSWRQESRFHGTARILANTEERLRAQLAQVQ